MAAPQRDGGIALQLDSAEWYRISRDLRAYDPALLTALRKRLRSAGDYAVQKIKANLAMPSPDGGPDTGEMRDLLARATRVSISFSQRQAGVKITTSARSLPEQHRAVLKVYNKDDFRHPVFGDTDNWVNQRGRTYFTEAFEDDLVRLAQQEVTDAMNDALAAITRTT